MSTPCPICQEPIEEGKRSCGSCGHTLGRGEGEEASTRPAAAPPPPNPDGPGVTRPAHPPRPPGQDGPAPLRDPDHLPPGTLLWDRFDIEARLGGGGMGVVYRVRDRKLNDRRVAVKLLLAEHAAVPEIRERFKQEVLTARDLRHPGIVGVYEYDDRDGYVGFAMELVDGHTLADHFAGRVPGSPFAGPATVERLHAVAALASPLAEALDFVHAASLVHRDVKPSNIMIAGPPADPLAWPVKLLDFGIVRVGDGSGNTGQVQPGTAEYMAPELISGRGKPSRASDIFSFGKVLYQALTGERLEFLSEIDLPSRLVEGLPDTLDGSLIACFGRPDRRPDSAAALASVIRVAANSLPEPEHTGRKLPVQPGLGGLNGTEGPPSGQQGPSLEGGTAERRPESSLLVGSGDGPKPSGRWGLPVVLGALVVLVLGGLIAVVASPQRFGFGASDSPQNPQVDPGDTATAGNPSPPEPATPEPSTPAPVTSHPNPAGIEWKPIPGGTFSMGSDDAGDSETPVRDVTVPAFEMSRTEVTVAQYRHCVDQGSCAVPAGTGGYCNWGKSGRDDHPINCVGYEQAQTFAAFAGARLPSEAEWEYAARGGEPYDLAGSSEPDVVACWHRDGIGTCEVGSKKANGYELADMSGNVTEWVEDCYQGSYEGAPSDGSARTSCSFGYDGSYRVSRGGHWSDILWPTLRAAARNWYDPSGGYSYQGFRLARDVP